MDNKEIEIKVELTKEQYDQCRSKLSAQNVPKIEKHQIDLYYSPENESFYDSGDRCIRLRTENSISILSYKQLHDENTDQKYIEEYETVVESGTKVDQILTSLHFKKEIIVDKYREEYLFDGTNIIALDHVIDLGYYIEIENRNESLSIESRNEELLRIIDHMGIDTTTRNSEGYANMMYRKNKLR